jgi:hypothetical protein
MLVERQAAQDDGVDDRENRRARANPKREDRQSDSSEGLRRLQRTVSGFEIIQHGCL